MTSLRARLAACLLALALVPLFAAGNTYAGEDDFEYGRALAAMGSKTGDKAYFDYARRVFQNVIGDDNRSDEMKDLCRYGLAEITKSEALGASANPSKKYSEIHALFKSAIETMEQFVDKNPKHKRANEASLAVGTTRLAFVQWARDLLESPEKREQHGASQTEVKNDAESMVRGAIRYFDGIRKGHDDVDASQLSQIAQYYWVLCQYYLALVHEPGTDEAKKALEHAALQLDDFITLNDGQLLAIYAQDIMGLTCWEQARQASTEDEKGAFYRQAVEWFGTCIDTPVEDLDSQRVVANGYFHLGQVCNEAGRIGATNFHRIGVSRLKDMEAQHKTITRQDNGIRALLEWSRLEMKRDRQAEAVEIARRAGEYAKKLGKGWLERQANRILREIIAGKGGGSSVNADPTVLMRVADDFFGEGKWSQAIAGYQSVIGAVERNPANVEKFLLRSWERISRAYKEQGDLVASALALEPIHGIWIDGLVDKTTGGKNNPNLFNLGNMRLRAQKMWKDLHTMTGSPLFNKRHATIRDSFSTDYKNHPSEGRGVWNGAMEKFRQAIDQKRSKNSRWRTTMNEADALLQRVAKDPRSQKQDSAWTYLVYTQYLRENWDGMLKAADAADKFWDSKVAKDQAKQFATVAKRRTPERGKVTYWRAEAMYRKAQEATDAKDTATATALWDKILALLEGWHADYDMLRGGTNKRFYAGTLGHMVFAHIGKGDIPAADKVFKRLLAEDPEYIRLPKITFALARHFNDQAKIIDAERKTARIELNGTEEQEGARSRLRQVTRREHQVLEHRVDLEAGRTKARDLVRVYEKKLAEGLENTITPEEYEEAKTKIGTLTKTIDELTEKGNKLKAEKETLETRVAELVTTVVAKANELYEPLTRAAGYFWEWDQALRKAGLPRDPNNIAIFADLYFKAGLLRPKVDANWERSQLLYDDYLAFESGTEEEKKHEAIGRLGTIYARLATAAEPGSDERSELVAKALDRLQGSLSLLPENNDMVVSLLEGKTIVIPYFHKDVNSWFYIPLPRISTAEEFKKAVASLGKPGGAPIPFYTTEVDKRRYMNMLGAFRQSVNGLNKAELDRTVRSFVGAGFDMRLYRRLARSSEDFRLALAKIYVESGVPENMTKAYNLASSLLGGTHGADEYSEDWWDAQVVRLASIVTGAELEAKKTPAGGKLSPTAMEWIERASKVLRGLNTTNPALGDDVRPETRPELKALFARIKLLRGKAGLDDMSDVFMNKPIPAGAGGSGAEKKK